jgi:hypothetical protein
MDFVNSEYSNELLAAFDSKYPYPAGYKADPEYAEALKDLFWHEFWQLPANNDAIAALLTNRFRMVLACNAANADGVKVHAFAFGPQPSYACDFVPVDKDCLLHFLAEVENGGWGAQPAVQAYLRANQRTDNWGLLEVRARMCGPHVCCVLACPRRRAATADTHRR